MAEEIGSRSWLRGWLESREGAGGWRLETGERAGGAGPSWGRGPRLAVAGKRWRWPMWRRLAWAAGVEKAGGTN
jgi:hypothetical protein